MTEYSTNTLPGAGLQDIPSKVIATASGFQIKASMKAKIGTVTLLKTKRFDDRSFECAAWWQVTECQPQTCDLILSDCIGSHTLRWGFKGKIVDADFTSHFGGVAFGKYDKSRDVGRENTTHHSPYEHSFLNAAFAGESNAEDLKFTVDPALCGVIAFEFDHKEFAGIKTHYHLVPIEKLASQLEEWSKVAEYMNVRTVGIPATLLP